MVHGCQFVVTDCLFTKNRLLDIIYLILHLILAKVAISKTIIKIVTELQIHTNSKQWKLYEIEI